VPLLAPLAALPALLATLAALELGGAEELDAGAPLDEPDAPLGCVPTATTWPPETVEEPSDEDVPAALDL